jgi:hypothetical protein
LYTARDPGNDLHHSLQTLLDYRPDFRRPQTGETTGFSLHAGVAAQAYERDKLERWCRYISRPALANQRLSLTRNGLICYQLKTPYSDGTTHVLFEPLDFMSRMDGMPRAQGCAGAAISRLVALIPRPRLNLTRFHGLFAPNSKHRGLITPARRGNGRKGKASPVTQKIPPLKRHTAMTWDRRLLPEGRAPPRIGLRQSRLSLEINSEYSDLTEFRNHPGGKCETTGCSITIYFWQHSFYPSYLCVR